MITVVQLEEGIKTRKRKSFQIWKKRITKYSSHFKTNIPNNKCTKCKKNLSFLWIEGVKQLGPNRCSIFINLLPVLTALFAVIWLHDAMHAYHVIGGGVTLAGVLLTQTVQKPLFTSRVQA